MKNKEWYHSIQMKMFFIFTVSIFTVSFLLYSFFAERFYSVYRQQAMSHLGDVENLAIENISNQIEQIEQLSVSILTDQSVQDNLASVNRLTTQGIANDDNALIPYTEGIRTQVRSSIFSVDNVISLRVYTRSGLELLIGTTNREYLEYPQTQKEIYAANGSALWGMTGERNYLCMCRAILSTSTMLPQGYMVIVCQNEYLSQRLATLPSAYSGKVYLLSEGGQVVAAGNTDMVGTEFPYTPAQLRELTEDTLRDPQDGEQSFYFVGPSLDNGWTLVTTANAERVMSNLVVNVLILGAFLLTALMIALFFTMQAVKKLMVPTQILLGQMRAFGEGDLDARVERPGLDEIGRIGQGYNRMADNIQQLLTQVYSLELANKEAEIEFLKMQINPHFLYNTLDTISWLGFTHGSEEISDLAVSLAQLLRSSIKNEDFITVRQEMKSVDDYLRIQRYRFEDRFEVKYDIAPESYDCYMPNFLLQPLIENCIMHGLEDLLHKGNLTLRIQRREWLCFEVIDNGKGMETGQVESLLEQCQDMKSKTSIGLKNVYRRLQLLYGTQCSFEIHSALGQGTSISFRLPILAERGEIQNETA